MPTAREYLRVSEDKSGRERSNHEQQDDNRAVWPDFDFNGAAYSDASISASRFSTKVRGGYDQLVDDITAGRFGADILVLWEGSRGSRRVGEWLDLIELLETHHIRIAVTADEKLYDPAIPRDRKSLLESAVDAEYESAKTSARVRRAARDNARQGRPHGRLLFGYRRVYDPSNGNLTGQEPHPEQAPVVRRVFADYVGGRSARSIARWLNTEEVKTNRGNGWTALMVHRMIRNPAYKARRLHRGEDIGPAAWPALVDEILWKAANDRHDAVAWKRTGYNASLLSGLVHCAACGSRMAVHHSRRPTEASPNSAYYGCQNGYHAYRAVERLDAFMTAVLLRRLRRGDAADALESDDIEDPVVAAARARRAELQADLDEAMACWRGERPGRRLTAQRFAEMETHLLPQIAECERTIRAGEAIPLDIDLPAPEQVDSWWDGLDPEMRRVVMGAFVASVSVAPTGRGRRHFDDADYTTIEWRR